MRFHAQDFWTQIRFALKKKKKKKTLKKKNFRFLFGRQAASSALM